MRRDSNSLRNVGSVSAAQQGSIDVAAHRTLTLGLDFQLGCLDPACVEEPCERANNASLFLAQPSQPAHRSRDYTNRGRSQFWWVPHRHPRRTPYSPHARPLQTAKPRAPFAPSNPELAVGHSWRLAPSSRESWTMKASRSLARSYEISWCRKRRRSEKNDRGFRRTLQAENCLEFPGLLKLPSSCFVLKLQEIDIEQLRSDAESPEAAEKMRDLEVRLRPLCNRHKYRTKASLGTLLGWTSFARILASGEKRTSLIAELEGGICSKGQGAEILDFLDSYEQAKGLPTLRMQLGRPCPAPKTP